MAFKCVFFPPYNFTHTRHKSEFKREHNIVVKLKIQASFFLCISQSFLLGWTAGPCGRWMAMVEQCTSCGKFMDGDTVWRIPYVLGILTAPFPLPSPRAGLHGSWGDQGKRSMCMRELICQKHTKVIGILRFCSLSPCGIPVAPGHCMTTQHDIISSCVSLGERDAAFQAPKGFSEGQ